MNASSAFNLGLPKLTVLLTEDRDYPDEHWTVQVSRLLEPMGVAAYLARNGKEAVDLAAELEFHVAVIDLGTPKSPRRQPTSRLHGTGPSLDGLWILEQLRRLPKRPPVVVVDGPAFSRSEAERVLRDALRLGAFSVLHKPVQIEQLLAVFQRLVDRRYEGYWPTNRPPA